ncbi:MAG TPA: 8-amino-7-oxononanoate synthase [Casimicrobiaceae bacterium]|jgi:8-amino-7-oxononanoate synthase|nr:8-amino-7-oxononanoate synthase [Casimicrobiaceae bacterium]
MLAELEESLRKRRAQHLWRERRVLDSAQGARVRIRDREYVSFASNDYLGLANRPELVEAACAGARRFGVGAGASHLVVGHQEPHEALEQELAQFVAPCAGARAVTFSSGYLANLAILTALAGRHDTIVADRLNHACLVDGALLARAKLVRYPHLDLRAAERALAAAPGRRVLATDAVFSMDGDLAPLPDLLALADACDAWLVVDDAHGFGVLGEGRGSLAHFGIASERIVYMGTLGKAAGVAGAFVAAHPAVIESIVQTARPYIYTTAAPALLAHALRGALTLVRDGARERAHLASLVAAFREAARELPWSLLPSATPIQPLVVGDAATTVRISRSLEREGLLVPAIRPPTVPAGTSRLRVSLSAAHAHDDVRALTRALGRVAADA